MMLARSLLSVGLLASALVAAPPAAPAAEPSGATTSVLAGGSFGDGLEATRASLNLPRGVTVAGDGSVYVADFFHHQVRVVRPDGTIHRVAGTWEGFGGDNGQATRARLNRPMGLSIDGSGGLLIADAGNNRIRRVDLSSGIITTVAGDGERTYAGDGGPATQASLAFPYDVAAAPEGGFYIADYENYRVRRVLPDGTMTTFAGNGTNVTDFDELPAEQTALLPASVFATPDRDVYIGDELTCSVRMVDRQSRRIHLVAGGNGCGSSGDGGPATEAALRSPTGLEVTPDGRIFIADVNSQRVRMVDPDGIIHTVLGDGTRGCPQGDASATGTGLTFPFDVDVTPDGDLVVVSQDCNRAYRVSGDALAPFAGNGTLRAGGSGDPARSINFTGIQAVVWSPDGRPYFAEDRGIWTITDDGRAVIVAGGENGDADGPALEAKFRRIYGMAFDADGTLWIGDGTAGKIKTLADGLVTTVAGDPSSSNRGDGAALEVRIAPLDLVPMPDGSVVFTEGFGRVRRLDDGQVTTVGGVDENRYLDPIGDGGPVSDALFREPWGIARGPDGSVYVADRQHQRIRRIAADGTITTVAGDGGEVSRGDGTLATLASFSTPEDVVVGSEGDLFVTDGKNAETSQPGGYVVRHVAPNGMVTRLAGTGSAGEGLDGPSLGSPLKNPQALALGDRGLLVGDHTTLRLIEPGENGWPRPARSVTCERFFTDIEGDAKAQYGVSFVYGPNMPWADLLWADATTDDEDLTVTMQFLDINERVLAPPGPEIGTAWAWTYFLKAHDTYKYVTAFAPYPATAPGGIAFEYGDSGLGRGSATKTVTRRGAATGSVDFETDRVTITAPLSGLGLKAGDVVLYHEATGGELVEAGFSRFVNPDDTTSVPGFLPGTARSYTVGKRCPQDY